MENCVKLYYFAYLSVDNSFIKITLNAEENESDYRVISTGERPASLRIWHRKWKNLIIPKDDIDKLKGAFLYEMFCTEDNPLLLLCELYLMYRSYVFETKAQLSGQIADKISDIPLYNISIWRI